MNEFNNQQTPPTESGVFEVPSNGAHKCFAYWSVENHQWGMVQSSTALAHRNKAVAAFDQQQPWKKVKGQRYGK